MIVCLKGGFTFVLFFYGCMFVCFTTSFSLILTISCHFSNLCRSPSHSSPFMHIPALTSSQALQTLYLKEWKIRG